MNDNLEDEVRGSNECGDNVVMNEDDNFIYNPQVADHLKPSVGKEFQTIDEVRDFYNAYAKEAGFSIRSWATKKIEGSDEVKRKEYVCFKQGKRITIADVETKRRCHGCGKVGQSHDKRNCPMVSYRDSPDNEGATTFSSSDDDSHTSKGSEMFAATGCC